MSCWAFTHCGYQVWYEAAKLNSSTPAVETQRLQGLAADAEDSAPSICRESEATTSQNVKQKTVYLQDDAFTFLDFYHFAALYLCLCSRRAGGPQIVQHSESLREPPSTTNDTTILRLLLPLLSSFRNFILSTADTVSIA